MLPVELGGISGENKYQYDMSRGLLLTLLGGDQLVDPCFDGIDFLGHDCPSKPTECIP